MDVCLSMHKAKHDNICAQLFAELQNTKAEGNE